MEVLVGGAVSYERSTPVTPEASTSEANEPVQGANGIEVSSGACRARDLLSYLEQGVPIGCARAPGGGLHNASVYISV